MTIPWPPSHLHVEGLLLYAWSLLSPWRFQLVEMTYLPFFPHGSLGIQLILNTALNQKQTWAQGTSSPEDREGTNTIHQRRNHLGQIFRARFLQALLPCRKQGTGRDTRVSWEMRGTPMDTLSRQRTKSKGQREETNKIHSSQVGLMGGIYSSEWYLLPSHNVCTDWQLWLARLLCQHLQVRVCSYVKGKQERKKN